MFSPSSSQAANFNSAVEPATAIPAERPEQPAFNESEVNYLGGFLDEYLVYRSEKKGDKKWWDKQNVYPKYTVHFGSLRPDGSNLVLLFKVHLYNHQIAHYTDST